MRKVKTFFIMTIFLTFLFLSAGISLFAVHPAKAFSQNVTHNNYKSEFGLDETLFLALLALRNEVCSSETFPSTFFSSSFFVDEYASYTPSSADGESIKADLEDNKLNLTLGENSPYDCLKNFTTNKIISIRGLNNLDLSTIKTLILDDNKIFSISANDLEGLVSIYKLSVNNNNLSFFAINPTISGKIIYLNLRNNALKKIDISTVALNAEVDLASNLFESIDDIEFGNSLEYLDLSFNNITESFNLTSFSTALGVTPIFLVQGLNKTSFTAGQKIAVVNDTFYGKNLIAHIKYNSGSDYFQGDVDIVQSAATQGLNFLTLPAGEIEISFTFDSSSNLPEENEVFLENKEISSKLPAPKVSAVSDGLSITTYSQHSPMTFSFSMNDDNDFVNRSVAMGDAVLYSGIQGEEKANSTTFNIDTFMTTTLSAYYVFDGISGDKLTLNVSYSQQSNLTLGVIVVIITFVVIASVVYIVRWIKNGTPITPLSPMEIAREQRRRERKQGSGDFPYAQDFENVQDDKSAFPPQDSYEKDDMVDLLNDENDGSKNEEGRYRK